ncbi:recombination protein RecR [Candidatus Uhrbacteria bacterium]|jgi:recombination protein RecR|nr:recombination protein RecR [Candidatus Uhrbacteria bacterium]
MREYPRPIQNLVTLFTYLPGVGPKTALRYVFYLLKQPKGTIESMSRALHELQQAVTSCSTCKTYTTQEICEICLDSKRDKTMICAVAHPRDIGTIDSAGFRGRYHVLGGTLSPIEGITPDTLEINSLFQRLTNEPAVSEVVLAFNPDIEGEATIMYLSKLLKARNIKASRLARGLPAGSDLEFADEVTLGDALHRRWEV